MSWLRISIPKTIEFPVSPHKSKAGRTRLGLPGGRRKRTDEFTLTGRLQLTLQIIEGRLSAGRCPSICELAAELGITPGGVRKRLLKLERYGYISRDFYRSRSIRLNK